MQRDVLAAERSCYGVVCGRVRGFGRAYLPLTESTQPFVEGFTESSTYNGEDGGLTYYGGALGVWRMLNARAMVRMHSATNPIRLTHHRSRCGWSAKNVRFSYNADGSGNEARNGAAFVSAVYDGTA